MMRFFLYLLSLLLDLLLPGKHSSVLECVLYRPPKRSPRIRANLGRACAYIANAHARGPGPRSKQTIPAMMDTLIVSGPGG